MSPQAERLSRRLNAALGGDPTVMLCARIYRHRKQGAWPLVLIIDLWARLRWGEPPGHCSRIHARERLRRLDDPAARARFLEGQ